MDSSIGLKRSMPCSDLFGLSGESPTKEHLHQRLSWDLRHEFVKDASWCFDEPMQKISKSTKRQRTTEDGLRCFDSPATAALEAALAKDAEVSLRFDQHDSLVSQLSLVDLSPFVFKEFSKTNKKQPKLHYHESSIPSVHSLSEITRVLARITTTTSA